MKYSTLAALGFAVISSAAVACSPIPSTNYTGVAMGFGQRILYVDGQVYRGDGFLLDSGKSMNVLDSDKVCPELEEIILESAKKNMNVQLQAIQVQKDVLVLRKCPELVQ